MRTKLVGLYAREHHLVDKLRRNSSFGEAFSNDAQFFPIDGASLFLFLFLCDFFGFIYFVLLVFMIYCMFSFFSMGIECCLRHRSREDNEQQGPAEGQYRPHEDLQARCDQSQAADAESGKARVLEH